MKNKLFASALLIIAMLALMPLRAHQSAQRL